jgi:ATP-dependent DNA helicase RecQ
MTKTQTLEDRVAQLEETVTRLEDIVGRLPVMAASREVSPEDQELADELRAWRRGVAEAEGCKPFHVFGDAILAAIASNRPSDRFELAKIRGIGEQRMEKYGSELVGIVRRHSDW